MFILKSLERIDIFGKGIKLRIKDEKYAKTILGGILTVIILVLIGTWVFFEFYNRILFKNPRIEVEIQVMSERPAFILDKYTMPFAISFSDGSNNHVEFPGYLEYVVNITTIQTGEKGSIVIEKTLETEKCEREHFPKISEAYFYQFGLNNFLCVKNQNFSMYGFWDEQKLQYASIIVRNCQNSTSKIACKSREEIEKLIARRTFFFNIYLQNTNINAHNRDSPITHTMLNLYKMTNSAFYKEFSIFITREVLQSDDGILVESTNTQETLSFDYSDIDEGNRNEKESLIEMILYSSNNRKIIRRSYKKIQDILSDVGGFLQIICVLFSALCSVFSTYKRDLILLNQIFNFDQDIPEHLKQKRRKNISVNGANVLKRLDVGTIVSKNKNKFVSAKRSFELEKIKYHESKFPINKSISRTFNHCNFINVNTLKKENARQAFNTSNDIIVNDLNENRISDIPVNPNFIEREDTEHDFREIKPSDEANYSDNEKLENFNTKMKNSINTSKLKDLANIYSVRSPKLQRKETVIDHLVKRGRTQSPQKAKFKLSTMTSTNNPPGSPGKILRLIESKEVKYVMDFTLFEIINILLCKFCSRKKLKDKHSLYLNCEKEIKDYLDVTFYVKKMEEFERLKFILFSKDQYALFSFGTKDFRSLDIKKVLDSKIVKFKDFTNNKEKLAKKAIKYYHRLVSNADNTTKMDRRLFALLNEDFKEEMYRLDLEPKQS